MLIAGVNVDTADIVIILGGVLGALAATSDAKRNRNFRKKSIDFFIGIFGAYMIGKYYGGSWNVWGTGLLALVAGGSCAVTLDILLGIMPNVVSKIIIDKLERLTGVDVDESDKEEKGE